LWSGLRYGSKESGHHASAPQVATRNSMGRWPGRYRVRRPAR
jgi:hypothetical protein